MFQSFAESASPAEGPGRLAKLRDVLSAEALSGFLVPRADVHQGEYVAPRDDRLAWLTGFTGSAGFCAALLDQAGVFIDGRYRTQVKAQVDLQHFTPVPWPETQLADWLKEQLPEGGVIGIDPWLHTVGEVATLVQRLQGSGITLREVDNLLDRVWSDQPAAPIGAVTIQPEDHAGESHAAKRARLAAALRQAGQSAAVITLPDSLAWLLNIRGSDIARNPVPHGFAILHDSGAVDLFMAAEKLPEDVRTHLGSAVALKAPDELAAAATALTGRVLLDKGSAPLALQRALDAGAAEVVLGRDPVILPKACKNPAEIAGARTAHLRDGAAMCEFLAWYDEQPVGSLTEIDVVTQLEACRRDTGALLEISFDTISGTGPNGAVIHYRVTEASNARLENGHLLVLDSGGQYQDGTTDITRTLAVGDVGQEERACFTRVLQGMIAVSQLRFPAGLSGRDIDGFARAPLWAAGLDYNHGTGHVVGAYLSVHEGPQGISRRNMEPLQPGMILSNEPGYYREGAFGIRIENLIVVEQATALSGADDRAMLSFETLTYVPIDRRLIAAEMLSESEREWLNSYHKACRDKIGPRLSAKAKLWLAQSTAPI
ncbi:MAG: aminopeptidase P family protein [Pseudomonadota bacterium]|nr:aminopeptidase P family protein [Pseudomonadota bacterium]